MDSIKDGPNLAPVLKALPSPSPTLTPTPTPAYGIILISEVMAQPAGIEPDGEWVELYNPGGGIIDLSTYKLGDEETRGQGEGMLQFPAGARLAPGQVIVIANHAANFISSYGFNPDFEMNASLPGIPDMRKVPSWATGSINLGNNGDEVLVLDNTDSVADSLSWGDSSWAFYPACPAPPSGWTLERYPAYSDTNSALDWRLQSVPGPGLVDRRPPTPTPTHSPTLTRIPSETSSPTLTHSPTGTSTFTPIYTTTLTMTFTPANTALFTPTSTETNTPTISPTPSMTPSGGRLLISEVMYDPFSVEPDGEWIELYNAGSAAIDLTNYKVGDAEIPGDHEGMYQFPAGASIEAGQVIVIADRADVFTSTYGFYPDYELIDSVVNVPDLSIYLPWSDLVVNLSNPGDEVLVLDEADGYVDTVSWGDSNWAFDPDCPVVAEGHSIERNPANVDSNTSADWIDQASPNPGQVNTLQK